MQQVELISQEAAIEDYLDIPAEINESFDSRKDEWVTLLSTSSSLLFIYFSLCNVVSMLLSHQDESFDDDAAIPDGMKLNWNIRRVCIYLNSL